MNLNIKTNQVAVGSQCSNPNDCISKICINNICQLGLP